MSTWSIVLTAAALGYLAKLAGYLVPARLVSGHRSARVIGLLPVALLAALVAVQTFSAEGGAPTIDARVPAIAAAVVLLALRVNFLVVVVAAALIAAVLRALGVG